MVPGLYSLWLRLWGSRVGRLVYWTAGVQITDRTHLEIGQRVLVGQWVRMSAHAVYKSSDGDSHLVLQTLQIGDGAIIGGQSLLGPKADIAPHTTVKVNSVVCPYLDPGTIVP